MGQNLRNLNKNMEDKIKLTIHAAGIGERLPIPLAGQSVKAGFPSPAQDYMEGEIDLNEVLIRHREATFYVRISGDSMTGAGIRGRRDGDGLTPRREHRPTVAATLGDEKLVARLQTVDYGQVVDAAPRPSRESEAGNVSRLAVVEVPVLHPYEVALSVVVGRGEPVDALSVGPGGESAPSRHPRVDASLVKEEAPCRPVEPWVLEEPPVSRGIEGALAIGLRLCRRFPLREDDAVGVGKPLARLREVEPEVSHHEVDGTHALLHAHKASAGVAPGVVDEAGVMIVVERAEALVPRHAQSYSLGDPLNGQVAELLNFIFFHKHFSPYPFRYSCVFE